jgi:hypothetical protein
VATSLVKPKPSSSSSSSSSPQPQPQQQQQQPPPAARSAPAALSPLSSAPSGSPALPAGARQVAERVASIAHRFGAASDAQLASGLGAQLNEELKACKAPLAEWRGRFPEELAEAAERYNELVRAIPARVNALLAAGKGKGKGAAPSNAADGGPCFRCRQPVTSGGVRVGDVWFHGEHLTCGSCGRALALTSLVPVGNDVFCDGCGRRAFISSMGRG